MLAIYPVLPVQQLVPLPALLVIQLNYFKILNVLALVIPIIMSLVPIVWFAIQIVLLAMSLPPLALLALVLWVFQIVSASYFILYFLFFLKKIFCFCFCFWKTNHKIIALCVSTCPAGTYFNNNVCTNCNGCGTWWVLKQQKNNKKTTKKQRKNKKKIKKK